MIIRKRPQYRAIIFDLGGVVFTWTPPKDTGVPPRVLKKIIASKTWCDYESGKFDEDTCYNQLALEFDVEASEIARTFNQAHQSLVIDPAIISLIDAIRAADSSIAIYAMSNISQPDYIALLRNLPEIPKVFDRMFPSGYSGARKPDLAFYRKVLREIETAPENVIFVDDQLENVIAAQSTGINGILYTDAAELTRRMRNLIYDPVERGRDFLQQNAGFLHSITTDHVVIPENFSQLLILEVTGDRSLVYLEHHEITWNFFQGKPTLTGEDTFPDDVDTTSIAWTTIPAEKRKIDPLLDRILGLLNEDGIVTTYFDPTRVRVDPVVCVNVLRLFSKYGRANALPSTFRWVYDILLHRAYLQGTRYYTSPEIFLYFVSRLCQFSENVPTLRPLKELLIERLKEQIQIKGDALSLAMRILACMSVGIAQIDVDLRELLAMQCGDGSWEPGLICRYGSANVFVGNRGLTTAFAIKAIEVCH